MTATLLGISELSEIPFFDLLLLIFCPLAALTDGAVYYTMTDTDFEEPTKKVWFADQRNRPGFLDLADRFLRRSYIVIAVGALVALFFFSTLGNSANSVSRIIALSMMLGYSASKA